MNDERREHIQQHIQESFTQDRIANLERIATTHNQTGRDKQIDDRIYGQRKAAQAAQSDDNLLCACNGLACEGVCREQHLHRPRVANPTATKKEADVVKSWAAKCPEAYKNKTIIGR